MPRADGARRRREIRRTPRRREVRRLLGEVRREGDARRRPRVLVDGRGARLRAVHPPSLLFCRSPRPQQPAAPRVGAPDGPAVSRKHHRSPRLFPPRQHDQRSRRLGGGLPRPQGRRLDEHRQERSQVPRARRRDGGLRLRQQGPGGGRPRRAVQDQLDRFAAGAGYGRVRLPRHHPQRRPRLRERPGQRLREERADRPLGQLGDAARFDL